MKTRVPRDEKDEAIKMWTSVIRDKITGKANEALLNSQTECRWDSIKTLLTDRFGDKRDIASIINNIPYIQQRNRSVEEFYEECNEILTDLNAKILLDPGLAPCSQAVIASYEALLINAYVDGLHEPISSLTRTSKPNTLLAAFQHTLEQSNAADRKRERTKLQTAQQKPNLGTHPPNNQMRNLNQTHVQHADNNFRPFLPARQFAPVPMVYQRRFQGPPAQNFYQPRQFAPAHVTYQRPLPGPPAPKQLQLKQEPASQTNSRQFSPRGMYKRPLGPNFQIEKKTQGDI